MSDYDYLFGILGLLFGVYLVSLGGRFYKVTMFLSAQLAFTFAFMIALFATVYPSYSPEWVAWITLVAGLGIGAGLGWGAQRWPFFGVFVLGTIVGCSIGAFIFSIGFASFASDHPNVVLWCTMATMGALVSVAALIFFDYAVILFSATMGAYILIRVNISSYSIYLGYVCVLWKLS